MATTLAEVLRHFGPDYLREHALGTAQAHAWRAITACRTEVLGGQRLRCGGCGHEQWRWHSCRNRHCPLCQSRARDAWRSARMVELLNVPYCHLVFTLPHELNALARWHPRWVYETLMQCVAATLTEFAANPRWIGGVGSFTLVLHTWTQELRQHLHVHALMAGGALKCDTAGTATWLRPTRSERFLFPVQALSRVLRGKFLAGLQHACEEGTLPRDPADSDRKRSERAIALRRHDWVVYAKTPMAGPAAVLDYLSRYTHRTAIGNERLVAIEGENVLLRVRADEGGKKRIVRIPGGQFIGRFLQHVLPSGFKRIRHYGLLSPAAKTHRLAQARSALAMPAENSKATEDAKAFMQRIAGIDICRCPRCGSGLWRTVQSISSAQATLRTRQHRQGSCRGPP